MQHCIDTLNTNAQPAQQPLRLSIADGTNVTLSDWSPVGFTYPATMDSPPERGVISIPNGDQSIHFTVRLGHAPGSWFLSFEDLTSAQRAALAVFFRSHPLKGRPAEPEEASSGLEAPDALSPEGPADHSKNCSEAHASSTFARIDPPLTDYIARRTLDLFRRERVTVH